MLILHFKHLLNSLVCECYSYWGCCVHFDYNNYTVVWILFMINKTIYVNTTQFNVDIFVIDIYYLFQNQKIKNTSILNFNLTCKTYFHWLLLTVKFN